MIWALKRRSTPRRSKPQSKRRKTSSQVFTDTFTDNESDRASLFKRQIATAETEVLNFLSGAVEQLEAVTEQHAAAQKELLSENETSASELITTMEQALARALAGAKDSTLAMMDEIDTLKEQAREVSG